MSKLVPAGLIALALVPTVAGAVRLGSLTTGDAPARFADMPAPVVVHIAGALIYSLIGAFQFDAAFRRKHRTWHRRAGRVLVVAGLAVALSGAWMTLLSDLPDNDGTVVNATRVIVSAVMAYGLVVAVLAIRRGDIRRHRAWMIRAYALALGAGTQAFTLGPVTVLNGGQPGVTGRTIGMLLGWAINVAVAEWIIRRRTTRPAPRRAGKPVDASRDSSR